MIRIISPANLLSQLLLSFPEMSRSKLKLYLQQGRILVNGQAVKRHDFALSPGDTIDIGPAVNYKSAFASRHLKLIYEDKYLVVINKNAGVLSMATSHHSFCVKTVLDNYFERTNQRCRAHLVHRLDRETSGLMIFAKSINVQQLFEADWKGIVYDRRYVAVARGHLDPPVGTISNWLSDNKQYFSYSSPVDNGGKWAVTHYRVLRSGRNNDLVEARLDTGRKNQIRVHFSDMGHPVLGDIKYGAGVEMDSGLHSSRKSNASNSLQNSKKAPESLSKNSSSAERLCLHAYRLHFMHPITRENLCFDTPIPTYFVKQL